VVYPRPLNAIRSKRGQAALPNLQIIVSPLNFTRSRWRLGLPTRYRAVVLTSCHANYFLPSRSNSFARSIDVAKAVVNSAAP
jgi:hypothetical protein